ncbi:septation ring formation regulator EzrA [Periweissella ghanensis]|uniref:Septation ring formation regulator EzrA n=1 Tax=Periweissella ghanensis TaxID=467997 RepID=A0ABM8ZBX0_9LACO|nr:septation ring formation regulator EzrA [Periweissella ghanensis]MCM0601801.1 septation ring formation regulator EzrA [Periweissella ghanensis]CAH0418788.1 Septation ring formation regulator EzrA [Periweissella ghanensis]
MNSGPLRVIIGIVIVAIVVYVVIFVMQRTTTKRVRELQDKKQKLTELDTKLSLVEGKKLSLTGQSLKRFDDLQTEYNEIENVDFKTFDQNAEDVLFESKGWNVVKAKQSLKNLNTLLDQIAAHIVEVRQGIEALQRMDAEHREAVKKLEVEYQALRKTLLTRNFEFGESIDKLEEMLANLEDDFDEFTRLTEQGDHTAASDIYTQLHTETERLERIIDQIPAIEKQLQTDFPAQIKELEAAYQQLTTDGYLFPNKRLQAEIAGIETSRVITNNMLRDLAIDDASANTEVISKQIDSLYAQFQVEMDAKKDVSQIKKEVETFINHARHQNHLLMIELDRIGQRYILTDREEAKTQEFAQQIKQIETDYRQTVLDIQFGKAIYSQISQQFEKFEDDLTAVETKQQAIWEGLQGLKDLEKDAEKQFETAAFSVRDIKREVEHWNLPGLPMDYRQLYERIINQIDRLDRTMQNSHINMHEIKTQLDTIQADIVTLTHSTDRLYHDAKFAEQLFQSANRYRMKNQAIAAAYNEALLAYQNHYDFGQARDVLGAALEQVEPGIQAKIEEQLG